MVSRRTVLRTFGVGLTLSFAGGWLEIQRAAAQNSTGTAASDPWAAWQSLPDAATYPDPRIRAVAYGILSPNAQNFQPWRVRLDGDDGVTLFMELSRRLPVSDPPDRQLTVSFGTFVELMRIGASADGYRLDITPFPEGEPGETLDGRPIATIRFAEDAAVTRDPLLNHVLARATNRLPFEAEREVTAGQLATLKTGAIRSGLVDGTVDAAQAGKIRDIAHRAYVLATEHAAVRKELISVTRLGRAAVLENTWGPAQAHPAAEVAIAKGTLTHAALDDPTSDAYRNGLANYLRALDSARSYVWVLTPDNSRRSMFDGGREWMRLHLNATALGLKLQPHSQALQDFAEIEPLRAEIHAAVGASGTGRLQMLGRIGYAVDAPHSPRESVAARLTA